jgi:hypothetical protein
MALDVSRRLKKFASSAASARGRRLGILPGVDIPCQQGNLQIFDRLVILSVALFRQNDVPRRDGGCGGFVPPK